MIGLTWGPSTIAIMGLGVFIHPLQAEFGWSRAQVALVATVINLTVVVMSPIQGLLVDRFGSRRVVIPSLFVFAAGLMLLYYLPRNIFVFYGAWSLVVAASAGLLPGSFLRVVGTWFDRRLGLAMGVANSGIGLGNILVPLVAAAVIAAYGWRAAYLSMGLLVLVAVLPVCLVWLRERERPAETAEEGVARVLARSQNFQAALPTRSFRVMIAAFFLLGLINTALISQQVPMLIDDGMTPHKAALVQSFFGVFLLVGRLGAGALLDRIFAPILMIVVGLGAAAACLIYSTGAHGDIVFLAAALLGLVVGAEFDALGYLIKRYFGMAAFGKLYGVVFAVFQLGGALGAAAFAMSHSAFGDYRFGLYGAAAILLMACAAFSRLPQYPTPHSNEDAI
jgi:MFS family permease